MNWRIVPAAAFLSLPLLLSPLRVEAEAFAPAVSLQGYTGILNAPNAAVTESGTAVFLFSDQREKSGRWDPGHARQLNYFLSFGFLRHVEMTGRFSVPEGSPGGDLSANLKIRLPLPEGQYIPSVAAGIADVSGGASMFRTKYLVVSEELGPLRLSGGYGTGPDRMKGLFAGVEARVLPWLYLLGEKTPEEWSAGARVVSPQLPVLPASLQATVKAGSASDWRNVAFSVGLQVPLGINERERTERRKEEPAPDPGMALEQKGSAGQAGGATGMAGAADEPGDDAAELRRILERQGHRNLRVGTKDDLIVIEYENNRYNWNELDAMGIVLFTAAKHAPAGSRRIAVVMKKKNLRMFRVTAPREELLAFLASADDGRLRTFIEAGFDTGAPEVRLEEPATNSSFLTSSLVLYPGLTTFLGTEVSAFEYLLSVKPDLYVDLWPGAAFNARWDIPVAWSSQLDDGGYFRGSRAPARFERAMMFQGVPLLPGVTAMLGAGMLYHREYGTVNEVVGYSPDGTHRIRFKQAYSRNNATGTTHESYLASYRYWLAPLDLSVEGSAGRFWWNDTGFTVEMKRFFGDTAISLYYKNTRLPAMTGWDERRWQAAGVQFSFPLTPRRDMKPGLVQLRGSEEWSYAQETTIASKSLDGANYLPPVPPGINLQPPMTTDRVFYNRDRLHPSYMKEHLLRLREAYLTCGGE